jgi:PPIC-type PPIASE domain
MEKEIRAAGHALLREPFLHFTLIGALIFGGHYLVAKPTQAISVSAQTQRELVALFEQRQRRKPEPRERRELIERYVDEEVLFREGLDRGLLTEDPAIREQIVARMRGVLQGALRDQEPDDAQLRAFYQAHLPRYALPAAVSFTEYVLPGETDAVASALADAVRAGAAVTRAPRRHRERSLVQLEAIYDAAVAARIFGMATGSWEVVRWRENPRVVRVDGRRPASQRSFEEARDLVRADYENERAQTDVVRALKELRARFTVNVEGS